MLVWFCWITVFYCTQVIQNRTFFWISLLHRNYTIKIIMFLGSKIRPVCSADILTAIYEPVIQTMWDP
jgi:hypothetical protein